ncbi:heme-binding protein [Bartonella sp. HY038]|uniref:GlcG/HbpS family heme-binding protein n=1 Tax=Bartonella sp. HY038 TaxID=2759660 RepID=UPI0015FC718E|nr:heme-binding protein [Bartonella sp. HY038]
MKRILMILSLGLLPSFAFAQDLPTAPYLPLSLAGKAAHAALDACAAKGHNVSVAIVLRDGSTKVLLKADQSGPHTAGSAQGKAFTSAAMGRDSASLAEFIAKNPENAGLRDMDVRFVIQGGGLPIKIGDALVGGIGVGGAPSGAIDAECAQAGIDAIVKK